MDVVPYLSAVILISTIATIFLAVLSYAAFKLRDKRRPKAKGGLRRAGLLPPLQAARGRRRHRHRAEPGA